MPAATSVLPPSDIGRGRLRRLVHYTNPALGVDKIVGDADALWLAGDVASVVSDAERARRLARQVVTTPADLHWREAFEDLVQPESHQLLDGFEFESERFDDWVERGPDDDGGSVPIFAFRGVPARLHGLALEGHWRALTGVRTADLVAQLDRVRGSNEDSGQALPRLAPRRATVGANVTQGGWIALAEVQHARAQTRVPATDVATAGWRIVNLVASYALNLGPRDALLFVKLQNLGGELAYDAGTIGTVRLFAPLPRRARSASLRLAF